MHVIERHLELFQRELDDWKQPDRHPLARAEADEMAALCVHLWDLFKDRLRKRVPLDTDEEEEKAAYANRDLAVMFNQAFLAISELIDGLASGSHNAEQASQLKSASAEVSEMLA